MMPNSPSGSFLDTDISKFVIKTVEGYEVTIVQMMIRSKYQNKAPSPDLIACYIAEYQFEAIMLTAE